MPLLRENWVLSLHGQAESILDRRRHGAVLPAAVARQRQHAARLRQLAVPRSPRRCCPRRSCAGSPIATASTWRCSTTPARSRPSSAICRSGVSRATSASASVSIACAARRCASKWRRAAKGCAWSSPAARRSDDVELHDGASRAARGGHRPGRLARRDPARGRAARRHAAFLQRRSAHARARDPGRLEGASPGTSISSSIWPSTCSAGRATRPPTSAPGTSTPSTKCPIRAGSPTASVRARCRSRTPCAAR